MKRILSLLAIALATLFFSGCTTITVAPTEEERLEAVFKNALQSMGEGQYWVAYAILYPERTKIEKQGRVAPERITALMKMAATKGVEVGILSIRRSYSQGETARALELAKFMLLALKKEGIPEPDTILRIHEKIERNTLELFHIEYVFLPWSKST